MRWTVVFFLFYSDTHLLTKETISIVINFPITRAYTLGHFVYDPYIYMFNGILIYHNNYRTSPNAYWD